MLLKINQSFSNINTDSTVSGDQAYIDLTNYTVPAKKFESMFKFFKNVPVVLWKIRLTYMCIPILMFMFLFLLRSQHQ